MTVECLLRHRNFAKYRFLESLDYYSLIFVRNNQRYIIARDRSLLDCSSRPRAAREVILFLFIFRKEQAAQSERVNYLNEPRGPMRGRFSQ